jgi:hypothetical protein
MSISLSFSHHKMSSNHQTLLLILLVFFFVFIFCNVSPAFGDKSHEDSWYPIKNLTKPQIQNIGKFAVREHNYKANSKLVLYKLVKAEVLQGYGNRYNLTITAKDGARNDKPKTYIALVLDDQFMGKLHLLSFRGPIY